MARLIDADALEGYVLTQCSWYDNRDEDEAYNAVADAPTVDAETVRRGRWIERHSDFVIGSMQYHHDWLVCSVCGRKETDLDEREETKETLKYCHCGARMGVEGEK